MRRCFAERKLVNKKIGAPVIFSVALLLAGTGAALSYAQNSNKPMVYEDTIGGPRLLEEGQRPAMVHPTVEDMKKLNEKDARGQSRPGQAKPTRNLSYHGGTGGIGVEPTPRVYLILWGSQWTNNDPSGEAAILTNFYNGAGSSNWLNSVIQYCQGVAVGTVFCNGTATAAGNPPNILAGVWPDNGSAAPSSPSQSQIAQEAVRAAQQFGNTTAAS